MTITLVSSQWSIFITFCVIYKNKVLNVCNRILPGTPTKRIVISLTIKRSLADSINSTKFREVVPQRLGSMDIENPDWQRLRKSNIQTLAGYQIHNHNRSTAKRRYDLSKHRYDYNQETGSQLIITLKNF